MGQALQDRVAIVTGAGGGLGRAHALELARHGARVIVNDMGSAAEAVTEEIRRQGGLATACPGDVTRADEMQAMADRVAADFGRIDILVNNAGILRDRSFAKMTEAEFRQVFEVHVMGAFHCTKAVWAPMRAQGHGRIVMTTSSSGLYSNFGQANYGAAKMALVGLMQTLALEGAKHDIRVNCLAPRSLRGRNRYPRRATRGRWRRRSAPRGRVPAQAMQHPPATPGDPALRVEPAAGGMRRCAACAGAQPARRVASSLPPAPGSTRAPISAAQTPSADTGMTAGLLPPDALARLTPAQVSLGLLALVGPDAPTRMILLAGAGSFECAHVTMTEGIHCDDPSTAADEVCRRLDEVADRRGERVPQAGWDQYRHELGKAAPDAATVPAGATA